MNEQQLKKRVLFLCTGNSCRSQMTEGALRHLASDRCEVASAGTTPADVHPMAIKVMAEIGIDISGQRSKSVVEMMGERFDYVITVCDPAGAAGTEAERLQVFRRVRDEIVSSIQQFVSDHIGTIDSASDAASG